MAVIYYQLSIVLTLLIVRVVAPKFLAGAAVIWTGLTLINLFYPPLILIQLVVVWSAFAFLKPRRESEPAAAAPLATPKPSPVAPPAAPATSPAPGPAAATPPVPAAPTMPDHVNGNPLGAGPETIGQFKAAIMLEAMDRYALPIFYVTEFLADKESFDHLLWVAQTLDRSERGFDEKVAEATLRLKWKWDKRPSAEREAFEETDALLESIRF